MFNFGILSTHLPYIILFAVYIYTLSVSFQKEEVVIAGIPENLIVFHENNLAFSAYSQAGYPKTPGNEELSPDTPPVPDDIYIIGPPTCFRSLQDEIIYTHRIETNSSRAPPALYL